MDKITIIESLKICLGVHLASAKRRLYELEGVSILELDLAEVVFSFDAPDTTRYFSWEQADQEFELSVRGKSHLIEDPRPEFSAEDDALLSKLLGKRLTLFELYTDEFGNTVAALLRFENDSCVVAIGYETRGEETQTAGFWVFSGNDLYLWTEEEFVDASRKHKLELVAREKEKISL